MINSLNRIRRRFKAVADFAATGSAWNDCITLGLAGLARHRPFSGDSLYAQFGRWLTPGMAPRVKAAGGQRISMDLEHYQEPMIFEEIFVDRTYPVEKVPFVPDLVIDCGAFCGMFSLLARARFPTTRFIAFEPEPRNFERLRRNVALNQAPIEINRAAVGTSDGTACFSGEGFGGHVNNASEQGGITVEQVSLAGLLRRLKPERLLLKLDVEGAEREILPDILPLLPPHTVIFLETHHEEPVCEQYLRPCCNAGFLLELVRDRMENDQPSQFRERMLVRNPSAPIRHYCTYFDSNYGALGLALYSSLSRHSGPFKLWVLCLDEACHTKLATLALPGVVPIPLAEFERDDAALLQAKGNRSPIEYYFTCTPSLPLYILRQDPSVQLVTYLDSDLFFFANPELVFARMGRKSIAIFPHRFSPQVHNLDENGLYNVGWVSFRRDDQGLACLHSWRAQCLEWCYLRHEQGKYADQKYLDDWPQRFPQTAVIDLKGANLAMWNIGAHRLHLRADQVHVDDEPLIFFHFHGLRRPHDWLFNLSTTYYRVSPDFTLLRGIVTPYVECLMHMLRAHGVGCRPGGPTEEVKTAALSPWRKIRLAASIAANVLRGNSLIVIRGHVIGLP